MYFNFLSCYARDFDPVCKDYPEGCNRYCWGFHSLQIAYSLSNIPEIYRRLPKEIETPKEDANYIDLLKKLDDRILGFVEEGHGLFICGKSGTGKTMWACKLAQSYIKKKAKKVAYRRLVYFVDIVELLFSMKADFGSDDRKKYIEMMESIKEADLVIWDNVDGPYTDAERDLLFLLINERYSNRKAQIFTSLYSLNTLEKENFLGGQIVDRIRRQSYEVKLLSPVKGRKGKKLPSRGDDK